MEIIFTSEYPIEDCVQRLQSFKLGRLIRRSPRITVYPLESRAYWFRLETGTPNPGRRGYRVEGTISTKSVDRTLIRMEGALPQSMHFALIGFELFGLLFIALAQLKGNREATIFGIVYVVWIGLAYLLWWWGLSNLMNTIRRTLTEPPAKHR